MKWSIFKENLATTKHKIKIFKYSFRVCRKIMKRAIVHDWSKYSKEEAPYFAAASNTKDVVYGSKEYKIDVEVNLKPALVHHYKHNSHHPQHHKDGIKDMHPLDVIEMLIDWKASTVRYKGGDIKMSLKENAERYNISEKELKNYEKFLIEINAW